MTAPTSSATGTAAVPVRFDITVLDTPDPPRLAKFYAALLGWQVEQADDDWITISGGSGTRIAFQLAPDHVAPTWPDPAVPQQLHIDFDVDDLPAAAAFAESLGATRVSPPEVREGFVVFRDPSGHPFCLCD
jgi:predicted enzyme related to lactoylglutathione lyase